MPFIGVNPQTVRLTASPGASNSPNATTNGSAPLNNIVDTATAQNLPGMVAFYKDAQGQISALAYAIAQASITYGAALMHQAGGATTSTGVASTAVKTGYDSNVVAMATTAIGGYPGYFAGVAAGSVVNTGAYFWRYISGFVPDALVSSGVPSGHLLTFAATTANTLSSISNLNATAASNATIQIPVAFAIGAAPANGGLASVFLGGWYM